MAVRLKRIMRRAARQAHLDVPANALHDPIFLAYVRIIFVSLGSRARARHFALVLKKEPRLDLEHLSFVARHGAGRAGGDFCRTRADDRRRDACSRSSAFKEFARASGLYRDWWMTGAVYARDRRGRHRVADVASARRRTGPGLVRILCGGAGLRDRADSARADSCAIAPAANCSGCR